MGEKRQLLKSGANNVAKSKKRKYNRDTVNGYKFIQKDSEWVESPAYRDLSTNARCLLDELLTLCVPGRNGQINLSTRNAAKRLNVTQNTVMKAFDELITHGFIVITKGAVWHNGKARSFKLTFCDLNGREPTDDWRLWEPDKPVRDTKRSKKNRCEKLKQFDSKNDATPH